jgi:hypothetical protein
MKPKFDNTLKNFPHVAEPPQRFMTLLTKAGPYRQIAQSSTITANLFQVKLRRLQLPSGARAYLRERLWRDNKWRVSRKPFATSATVALQRVWSANTRFLGNLLFYNGISKGICPSFVISHEINYKDKNIISGQIRCRIKRGNLAYWHLCNNTLYFLTYHSTI